MNQSGEGTELPSLNPPRDPRRDPRPGRAVSSVTDRGSSVIDEADVVLLSAANQDLAGESGAGQHAVFIASFAEFYELHHAKIAASLALNFGNQELGREATDEAMTRAFQRWGTVSGHDNPAGWVYRVGLNWGRSWFRRSGRRLPWLDRRDTELPETSDPALRAALLKMDHRLRAVVVCRYFMDWSTNQTAAALDIPTGTVKSRLHQALGELRKQLTEEPLPANQSFQDPSLQE